jgi:hypothetical protein
MKNQFPLLLFGLGLIFLLSCRKERQPTPDLDNIFGEFKIQDSLKVSATSIDFRNTPSLNISASFSIKTDWKISIKGLRSNFLFTKTAFSEKVDLNWDGKADRPPSFGNEDAEVMLTFANQPDTLKTLVGVLNPIPAQEGVVMATFLPGDEQGQGQGFSITADQVDGSIGQIANTLGGNYFELSGIDKNNWWIGGLNVFPRNRHGDTAVYPLPPISPSSLFINAYVYGFGPESKVILETVVGELDGKNGLPNESYMLQTYVRWSGWQLLSIPYSRFNLNTNPGNSQQDTDRIRNVEFKALSNGGPSNTFIKLIVANPVFTTLKPYVY